MEADLEAKKVADMETKMEAVEIEAAVEMDLDLEAEMEAEM